jgi:hypothetical protein
MIKKPTLEDAIIQEFSKQKNEGKDNLRALDTWEYIKSLTRTAQYSITTHKKKDAIKISSKYFKTKTISSGNHRASTNIRKYVKNITFIPEGNQNNAVISSYIEFPLAAVQDYVMKDFGAFASMAIPDVAYFMPAITLRPTDLTKPLLERKYIFESIELKAGVRYGKIHIPIKTFKS